MEEVTDKLPLLSSENMKPFQNASIPAFVVFKASWPVDIGN